MRISDWSSDVCSSDLEAVGKARRHLLVEKGGKLRLGDRRAARPLGAEVELEPRHREGAVGAVRGLSLRSAGGEQGQQTARHHAATAGHERPPSRSGYGFLDRIVGRWNRGAVPYAHVNPIYLKRVEQIHRVGGSPPAIPPDPDLL